MRSLYDRPSTFISSMDIEDCSFEDCDLSYWQDPDRHSVVRDVTVRNCKVRSCAIGNAIIENCVLENLKWPGLWTVQGTVFRHVTLTGQFGDLMIVSWFLGGAQVFPSSVIERHESWYRMFNSQTDWALDISKAKFRGFTVRGLPARLIRRDPGTQLMVTARRLRNTDWKEIDYSGTYADGIIEEMFEYGFEDAIIVAPNKKPSEFKRFLEVFEAMRMAGIAEPD